MSGSYNSTVTVTIECGFGEDVFDTTITWTEITSVVREFNIQRGRSRVLDQMGAGTATLVVNNSTGNFNPWNTAGAYSPNVRVNTPIRIRATYNAVTYDLFRGFVQSWEVRAITGGFDPHVVIEAVDAFTILAMVEEELTESAEASGTRIGNLLDTAGWPAAWRDIDTGNHNVQALTAEFDGVLNQINRAVLVEQGLFWIAADGDATFRDGNTRIQDKAASSGTFSDDGADNPYYDLKLAYDTTQLWNDASVTRVDGVAQTSTDATSVGDYGTRALHLSETLHVADGESLALADWLVMENKDVRVRATQLVLVPEHSPSTLWPHALGREFLDRVNIERTDITGDDFDDDCHIEGVSHEVRMVGGRSWTTTFQLSPKLPFSDFWILGTSALGTDTRLGY